ncbi:MAG TPA: hypothetical protein VGH94_05700 [Acidimicrobiales bacterium]|jgi:hypothetical protein
MTGTPEMRSASPGDGAAAPSPDEVRLTMPASPDMLRVARLAAAGLAGQMGLTFDQIEDVKIAIDELCFALVRGRTGGDLTLTFRLGSDLEIEGVGNFDGSAAESSTAGLDLGLSELSALILGAVVDEHELAHDGERTRFRLLKRRD